MVTIRLARGGAKKRPYFHITVADSRRARDGKYIERVGFFNPIASAQDDRIKIDHERLDYWISKGAKITDRVKNIIKQSKFSPEEFKQLLATKENMRLAALEKKKVQEPLKNKKVLCRKNQRIQNKKVPMKIINQKRMNRWKKQKLLSIR